VADLDVADWNLRSPELERLREVEQSGVPIVGMELAPRLDEIERRGWERLRRAWQAMPAHPNTLELVDVDDDRAVLKFAAIDWRGSRRSAPSSVRHHRGSSWSRST
jgi:hypothetical protein